MDRVGAFAPARFLGFMSVVGVEPKCAIIIMYSCNDIAFG
jgi:hypothetical protein